MIKILDIKTLKQTLQGYSELRAPRGTHIGFIGRPLDVLYGRRVTYKRTLIHVPRGALLSIPDVDVFGAIARR